MDYPYGIERVACGAADVIKTFDLGARAVVTLRDEAGREQGVQVSSDADRDYLPDTAERWFLPGNNPCSPYSIPGNPEQDALRDDDESWGDPHREKGDNLTMFEEVVRGMTHEYNQRVYAFGAFYDRPERIPEMYESEWFAPPHHPRAATKQAFIADLTPDVVVASLVEDPELELGGMSIRKFLGVEAIKIRRSRDMDPWSTWESRNVEGYGEFGGLAGTINFTGIEDPDQVRLVKKAQPGILVRLAEVDEMERAAPGMTPLAVVLARNDRAAMRAYTRENERRTPEGKALALPILFSQSVLDMYHDTIRRFLPDPARLARKADAGFTIHELTHLLTNSDHELPGVPLGRASVNDPYIDFDDLDTFVEREADAPHRDGMYMIKQQDRGSLFNFDQDAWRYFLGGWERGEYFGNVAPPLFSSRPLDGTSPMPVVATRHGRIPLRYQRGDPHRRDVFYFAEINPRVFQLATYPSPEPIPWEFFRDWFQLPQNRFWLQKEVSAAVIDINGHGGNFDAKRHSILKPENVRMPPAAREQVDLKSEYPPP